MTDVTGSEKVNPAVCTATGLTFHEMAESAFDAFIASYYDNGTFRNADFWDNAEIFEAVVDAYEQTGEGKYLKYIEKISSATIGKSGRNWQSNIYNDDIMWLVIAYTRSYLLTGNAEYLSYAKENFDAAFSRSYSDDLGGGLWWRTDKQCKNSCICCPGSIAACLVGRATGVESYYEKAASVMRWEIVNLFEPETGRVYDCLNVDKLTKSTWASTYNQGTFIGACNLLYDHTKDEIYLKYAEKAAGYTIKTMFSGKVMNSENSGNDLIGFKGILTRWLYRYAKYTKNTGILDWLQLNAATAWSNRNSKGLIWTTWNDKTGEDISGYDVFGMSSAVALMFNCQMWNM